MYKTAGTVKNHVHKIAFEIFSVFGPKKFAVRAIVDYKRGLMVPCVLADKSAFPLVGVEKNICNKFSTQAVTDWQASLSCVLTD